jgi:predicted nuclease with TOPRIM domain
MRNNYYELKPKYEDLVKINAELKTKIIEKSNEYNNLFDNNKGIYKKISTLQKRNEVIYL